jgi:hypothetical protein
VASKTGSCPATGGPIVVNSPPTDCGEEFEGCTPGYWKNHPEAWGCGYTPNTRFFDNGSNGGVFTGITNKRKLSSSLTLMQSLNLLGGGYNALARHAVAALLNACHSGVNYPYTEAEIEDAVVDMFNTGVATLGGTTYYGVEALKNELDRANNLGCPLGNDKTNAPTVAQRTQQTLEGIVVPKLSVSTSPNPYNHKVRFVIQSPVSGRGTLELYNVMGQKIRTVFQGQIYAGRGQIVEYNVPASQRGTMMYVLRVNGQQVSGKLLNLEK